MITYDEAGNVTGDTSQPDQTPSGGLVGTPSLDEMKHALSMWGSKTADMAKQMLQTPFAAKQRMSNALPATLSQAAQLAQVPGEVTLATASSYPAAIAKEMGFPEASKAIQYQPRSPYTYPGKLPEQITGSSMGFGPIPELMQPEFQRGFTPNDARVLGAKATQFGREVKNIPTDFVNAQSGVKTLNPLGDTTLGTNLQSAADQLADVVANRRAQGKSAIPGVPDVLTPQTSMYAVRPKTGGQFMQPTYGPETDPTAFVLEAGHIGDVTNEIEPFHGKEPTNSRYYNLYEEKHLNGAPLLVEFEAFKDAKAREEFPDIQDGRALQSAIAMKYSRPDASYNRNIKLLNEFVEKPETQQLARDTTGSELPTFDEFKKRVDAARTQVPKMVVNHIMKYAGTDQDPLLTSATKGYTFMPASDVIRSAEAYDQDRLAAKREREGLDPLGAIAKAHEEKTKELDEASKKLVELNTQQSNLQPHTPEYNVLTNPINKLTSKIARLKEEANNLELGKAYETLSDTSIEPITAKEAMENLPRDQRHFFPYIKKLAETAPDTKLYDYNHISALGYRGLGRQLADDVVTGKISVDQLGNTSLAKYVKEFAEPRVAQEREAAKQLAKQNDVLNSKLKERLETVPKDKHFGNVAALELKEGHDVDDATKIISEDCEVLDHCVAQGGKTDRRHFLTGKSRTHQPIYNPITGERNEGVGSSSTSYTRSVSNGEAQLVSLRDTTPGPTEGHPVGTLQLHRISRHGEPAYNIGYMSGYQNDPIKPAYADGLRDYLNSRADEIVSIGAHGHGSDIYDTKSDISAIAKQLGMQPRELNKYDLSGLPRFVRPRDVRAVIESQKLEVPNAVVPTGEREQMMNRVRELEHQLNDFNLPQDQWQDMNDELRSTREFLRQYDNQVSQREAQPVANVPHGDISYDHTLERLSNAGNRAARDALETTELIDDDAALLHDDINDIISDAQMTIGSPDTYHDDPIGALNNIAHEIQRHIDRHMQNGSMRSHEIVDALENYLTDHRGISYHVGQQLERQRQQTDVPNFDEMTPSMIDLYQNGLDSPIQSSNNRRYSRQATNAYRDILGSIADQGGNPRDANSISEHLAMYHTMLDNQDPEVMADLGIRNTEQANQLSEMLEEHLTSIDRLERDRRDRQQVRQQQIAPPRTEDTSHTNNISQTIDNAVNNFSDVNQPNDVASFNSALQRAFQAANPVTNPEDYIGAILDEGRALAGTPARNALQNLAISMNNYHVAHPSARNERSANYDANRILGQQQQHQEQEPRTLRPHEISHLASQLLSNDRLHTGELDIPSSDATLWALDNGQLDVPEYRHIPAGPERARAMETLRLEYQTARDSVLQNQREEENNNPRGLPDAAMTVLNDVTPSGIEVRDQINLGDFRELINSTYRDSVRRLQNHANYQGLMYAGTVADEIVREGYDRGFSYPQVLNAVNVYLSHEQSSARQNPQLFEDGDPHLLNEYNETLGMARHNIRGLAGTLSRLFADQRPPEGHKDGGHIKFAKNIDEMRLALMKGK